MKVFVAIILIGLILNSNAKAQTYAGSSGGQFLKIDAGARAVGMGSAFTAVADDASAVFWNPAGIASMKNNSAVFSHTYWIAGTYHDFASVIIKLSSSQALALSYVSLGMPDMEVTNEFYQDGTGEYFSANDLALGITYSFMITNEFSLGFTGKYISENIWHMNASSFAFDVGLLYHTPIKGLSLGMSITNVGPKLKYEGGDNFVYYSFDPSLHGNDDKIFAEIKTDYWDLPLAFKVGLAYQLLKTEYNALSVSCDAVHPNDYSESVSLGAEYSFKEVLFLRAGYKSLFKIEAEEGFACGVGLLYYITDFIPMRVDYSYSDYSRLKDVHRISLEIGF
ncbi:MAG: UPF0164 family protein [Chlorobi bacterium]|nr:UPF0164 family protein [Chlorobiota bacterium]